MASVIESAAAADDGAVGGTRRTKSASAFRTISEVADELDVAQHVLRFWESKFPQVRPLKRGGGRRYYRPEDVDLLRRIRSLLYDEGYTIKGAQKLLKGQRRSPTGSTPRENGDDRTVTPQKASGPEPALHAPLDAQQKQALTAVRSELADLRDSLRKLTS